MDVEEERHGLAQQLADGLNELEALKARKAEAERLLALNEIELIQTQSRAELSNAEWLRAEKLAEQATHQVERLEDRIEKQMLLMHDGSKALALLNSAAAAAMLAFAQALFAAHSFQNLKGFILIALVCFLAGALCASVMAQPLIRVMVRMLQPQNESGKPKNSLAEFLVNWLPRASTAAFFAGATAMVAGLWIRM